MKDLIYDMILESLSNYVESGYIDIDEAEVLSEAAYDELYYESDTKKYEEPKYTKPFSGKLSKCSLIPYGEKEKEFINDRKLINVIQSTYPKVEKLMYEKIDKLYKHWYDDEDTKYKSSDDVKKIMDKVLDTIVIMYREKTNILMVDYWANNYYNHPLSNDFFGGHSISCSIEIDMKTYKVKKINKEVHLEG